MLHSAQRVVVTGGTGFVGSHLVDRLLAETSARVVVVDNGAQGRLENLAAHGREPRLSVEEADVADAAGVAAALRGAHVVYHLAAQREPDHGLDGAAAMFRTNVVGTFNVLRAATEHRVRRVVFASALAAYGAPITLPVHESEPLRAADPYGASKAAAEAYCRAFQRTFGLQTTVLRLAAVYGPRDPSRGIPKWVTCALAGRDLEIDEGQHVVDLVWIGQTVDALCRAAASDSPLPPINIGSGTGTRLLDVARRILHLTRGPSRIRLVSAPPPLVPRFVANVERMRQMLGLEPLLDPLEQLPSLIPSRVEALTS
jgi:UDP-glucose 4-epimerase